MSKGLYGRISGFDQERKHLSQGDKLALTCSGEDAWSVYSQKVLQPPISAVQQRGWLRTLAFPTRDTAKVLPREAMCTTIAEDNW